MKPHLLKFSLILFLFSQTLYPCAVPQPGYGASADSIIANSSTILLVTVSNNKMKVKEVLKGDKDLLDLYILNFFGGIRGTFFSDSVDSKHNYENHFNDHTDKAFWEENEGRSPFPCCICAPLHEFSEGKDYLLFPDMVGGMKSAELIRNKNDKWYLYVKEKVIKK